MHPAVVGSASERIASAALSLFTEAGFAATTVPSIAQRAGVATGSIYRYFPSKESLANTVYRAEKTALGEALHAALDSLDDASAPREQVEVCWHALLHLLQDRREGVLFLEAQQHAAYLDERSREVSARVDAIVIDVIVHGQATGAVKDVEPGVLVAMLFGAFVGLAKAPRTDTETLIRLTTPVVWDLLSAKDER